MVFIALTKARNSRPGVKIHLKRPTKNKMRIFSITNFYTPHKNNVFNTKKNEKSGQTLPVQDSVSFGAKRKERNYETILTNIPKLPCACCGTIMIPEKSFEKEFVKDYDAPGGEILKQLKKYEPRMHKTEKEIVRNLYKLSKRYPDAKLDELFTKKYNVHLVKVMNKQFKILEKIDKTYPELSEESQKQLNQTVTKAQNILIYEDKNIKDKRKRIIRDFYELYKTRPEKAVFYRILQEAGKLPSSENDIDAYFVKYFDVSSKQLVKKLLEPSKSTIEHTRSQYENGKDHYSNYLVLCRRCNGKRNTTPYKKFIAQNPKMPENTQKYINAVIEYLNKHYVYGLEHYPQQIKATLAEMTEGEVILDISKYKPKWQHG